MKRPASTFTPAMLLPLVAFAAMASAAGGELGCAQKKAPDGAPAASATAPEAPGAAPASAAPLASGAKAELGKPAPDFTLPDLDGAPVSLASFKGKTVVLEWWNPGCPFVKASHTKGSLKTAAKDAAKDGVVWLAVNSGAPGKQGHGAEASREGKKAFGLEHPILLDATGDVGHAYGAERTPHVYVIDPSGTLVYRGAVDNSPDGEGESPEGDKLVSYVAEALAAVKAKRAVATAETKAYGCGVKYK